MAKRKKTAKVKRIIDGHLYDTEQSTLIAETRYAGASDEEDYKEGLYCNDHGVLFLAAEGGVESFYSALLQSGKESRGSDIIPLSTSEAQRWLEDHDHIKEYKMLFGEPTQAGHDTVQIDLRVSPDLKDRIENAASTENSTINEWLTLLIKREFG